jgi:hypothetical protein
MKLVKANTEKEVLDTLERIPEQFQAAMEA